MAQFDEDLRRAAQAQARSSMNQVSGFDPNMKIDRVEPTLRSTSPPVGPIHADRVQRGENWIPEQPRNPSIGQDQVTSQQRLSRTIQQPANPSIGQDFVNAQERMSRVPPDLGRPGTALANTTQPPNFTMGGNSTDPNFNRAAPGAAPGIDPAQPRNPNNLPGQPRPNFTTGGAGAHTNMGAFENANRGRPGGAPSLASRTIDATTVKPIVPEAPMTRTGKVMYGAGKLAGTVARKATPLTIGAGVVTSFNDHKFKDGVDTSLNGTLNYALDGDFDKVGESLKQGAVETGLDLVGGLAKGADWVAGAVGLEPNLRKRFDERVNADIGNLLKPNPTSSNAGAFAAKPGQDNPNSPEAIAARAKANATGQAPQSNSTLPGQQPGIGQQSNVPQGNNWRMTSNRPANAQTLNDLAPETIYQSKDKNGNMVYEGRGFSESERRAGAGPSLRDTMMQRMQEIDAEIKSGKYNSLGTARLGRERETIWQSLAGIENNNLDNQTARFGHEQTAATARATAQRAQNDKEFERNIQAQKALREHLESTNILPDGTGPDRKAVARQEQQYHRAVAALGVKHSDLDEKDQQRILQHAQLLDKVQSEASNLNPLAADYLKVATPIDLMGMTYDQSTDEYILPPKDGYPKGQRIPGRIIDRKNSTRSYSPASWFDQPEDRFGLIRP